MDTTTLLSPPTVIAWERARPASIQLQRDEYGQNTILVLTYAHRRYYFNRDLRSVKSLMEDATSAYFRGCRWEPKAQRRTL